MTDLHPQTPTGATPATGHAPAAERNRRWSPAVTAESDAVADRIRKERRAQELTQEELAAKCGMPRDVIVNIETRRSREIGVDVLVLIADALGIHIMKLWPKLSGGGTPGRPRNVDPELASLRGRLASRTRGGAPAGELEAIRAEMRSAKERVAIERIRNGAPHGAHA